MMYHLRLFYWGKIIFYVGEVIQMFIAIGDVEKNSALSIVATYVCVCVDRYNSLFSMKWDLCRQPIIPLSEFFGWLR